MIEYFNRERRRFLTTCSYLLELRKGEVGPPPIRAVNAVEEVRKRAKRYRTWLQEQLKPETPKQRVARVVRHKFGGK